MIKAGGYTIKKVCGTSHKKDDQGLDGFLAENHSQENRNEKDSKGSKNISCS